MRQWIIILFSIHLASGQVLLPELAKIPQLLTHFQDFRGQQPGNNWIVFLRLHYRDAQHRASDSSHEQLPLLHVHWAGSDLAPCTTLPEWHPLPALPLRLSTPDGRQKMYTRCNALTLFRPPACV